MELSNTAPLKASVSFIPAATLARKQELVLTNTLNHPSALLAAGRALRGTKKREKREERSKRYAKRGSNYRETGKKGHNKTGRNATSHCLSQRENRS